MDVKFKDLKEGDLLYLLDPKPHEITKVKGLDFARNPSKYMRHVIMDLEIKKSFQHPKMSNYWVIVTFVPLRKMSGIVTNDVLTRAKEDGVPGTEQQFFVPKDSSRCTAPVQMTIMATSAKLIEEWMVKTK